MIQEKLEIVANTKLRQIYDFNKLLGYNFNTPIEDIIPNFNFQNLNLKKYDEKTQKNEFKYTDRNSNIGIKLASSKSILYDFVILKENYLESQNLIATCGGPKIEIFLSNNTLVDKFIDVLTYKDSTDSYYTIDFIELENSFFVLFGGEKAIIRVLNLKIDKSDLLSIKSTEYKSLVGHRDCIYCIKINPVYQDLCLSSSHDHSIILYNYILGVKLAIFGGKDAHSKMVITVDWHFLGKRFCSGGADKIRIWEIEDEVLSLNEQLIYNLEQNQENNSNEYILEDKFEFESLNFDFFKEISKVNHEKNVNINGNSLLGKKLKNSEEIELKSDDANNFYLFSDKKETIDLNLNEKTKSTTKDKSIEKNKLLEQNLKRIAKINKKAKIYPFPIFTLDIHCGYTDGIIFVGDMIISKSNIDNMEGEILEWAPFKYYTQNSFLNKITLEVDVNSSSKNELLNGHYLSNNTAVCYLLVNRYKYEKNNEMFCIKMSYNSKFNIISIGDATGKINIFKRKELFSPQDYYSMNEDWFFDLKPEVPSLSTFLIEGNIRKVIVTNDSLIYSVNDHGTFLVSYLR